MEEEEGEGCVTSPELWRETFSSLSRITEVTPTEEPARGPHAVVRVTERAVGLRNVGAN